MDADPSTFADSWVGVSTDHVEDDVKRDSIEQCPSLRALCG